MLTRHHLTAVAATIFSVNLIDAIPTASSLSLDPIPKTVLYSWSTDPICQTTARKSDCATAYQALCARPDLGVSDNTTVGDCTAFYWYDAGNVIPKAAECTAAYTKILATSVGGALGYDAAGNRTDFPLYAIYPKDGNANCFKATGDTSPVLTPDALPGGGTLPTCPVGTSRRRRALAVLEGRDQGGADDGIAECAIEDGVWGAACTLICLATVTTTSWITGPFAAAGWLACLGGCSATGTKVYNNCQKAKGNTGPDSRIPLNPFGKRGGGGGGGAIKSSDPCHSIRQWSFQCPAQEMGLLSTYNCQQTINT